MTELTLGEQLRLTRLSLDRTGRGLMARALGSPLLRWRYGAAVADELLIVPQDLRTPDPTFAAEIASGHFGFAGRVAMLRAGSPFELEPPTRDWSRELHGFSWLRHLNAAGTVEARTTALGFVRHWIERDGCGAAAAWEPAVVGRRLMSWIVNGELLLGEVDRHTYERTTDSIARQLIGLSADWRGAPEGHPRLVALTALLYGDLCVEGHGHRLAGIERLFAAEIARQILPDGGHISRNPGVAGELLLDLLPLRQCFATRERAVPAAMEAAIARMLSFLRFMRLGDGTLARFNGMGASRHDEIATVLAYGDAPAEISADARASRYVRLQQGTTVVVIDVGRPPPLEAAAHAHAGCLSFEMSAGAHAVFVNAGAPGPADSDQRNAARSTAAHSTLCLASRSSARLVRHRRLERMIEAAPVRGPGDVRARTQRDESGARVEAAHDGYLSTSRLVHVRRLELDAAGSRLSGTDRLGPRRGALRLDRDLPFAIHFHLHPSVAWVAKGDLVDLALPDGARWRFTTTGASLSLEESMYFAGHAGPRTSHQIVLRGATHGETEVHWTLERETR